MRATQRASRHAAEFMTRRETASECISSGNDTLTWVSMWPLPTWLADVQADFDEALKDEREYRRRVRLRSKITVRAELVCRGPEAFFESVLSSVPRGWSNARILSQ
jgi:hypothetical protein